MHHAPLSGLQPGTTYYYRVGDGTTWSAVLPLYWASRAYPVQLAMLGDMGFGNFSAGTQAHLLALAEAKRISWVMHVGDVSYADGNQVKRESVW